MDNKKEKLVIIGNKPYFNFNLNPILDSFNRNIRCNMSIPDLNNGTKCDGWALCNHIYDAVIKHPKSEEELVHAYKSRYDEGKIREFYKNKKPTSEYSFFLEPRTMGVDKGICNNILKQLGCPYSFSKDPRMGYLALFWALKYNTEIYLSNWSITNEERVTYYVQPNFYESVYHEVKDEIAILRWLHENEIIDASLCLLKDEEECSFIEDELQPTQYILNKLNS